MQTTATVVAKVSPLTTSQYVGTLAAQLGQNGLNNLVIEAVQDTIALSEHYIYGSSRLGIQKYDKTYLSNAWSYQDAIQKTDLSAAVAWYSSSMGDLIDKGFKDPWGHRDVSSDSVAHFVGSRYYELTDHLGNVLATVLDRKTGHISSIPSLYDYYLPDLASATDYYPGGMPMSGRSLNGDKSPNGYNGKRNDNEVYGTGNFQDYGMRGLDARLMRFWGVDPLTKQYAYYTPYQFAGNKSTRYIDRDGLEEALDFQMQREEAARANGTMTDEQIRANQQARGLGALIGGAIVLDAWTGFTGSKVLGGTLLAGDFYDNPSTSEADNQRRNQQLKNDVAWGVLGWGMGKLLSSAIKAIDYSIGITTGERIVGARRGGGVLDAEGYANSGKLQTHLQKRIKQGYDFKTTDDMVKYGKDFFKRDGKNIFDFVDDKGYTHRLDIETQEYGILTPDNKIQSVFKVEPSKASDYTDGKSYMEKQIKQYGTKGE